jgi:hypothetical protein
VIASTSQIGVSTSFNDGVDSNTSISKNAFINVYDINTNMNIAQSNTILGDLCQLDVNQKVSSNDGIYLSNLSLSAYDPAIGQNTITLTALDTANTITVPQLVLSDYQNNNLTATTNSIVINSGTVDAPSVQLNVDNITKNTGDFSVAVNTGYTLNLDIPIGADLGIGDGAITDIPPGALTNLCMRIKVGSTYYKIQLMADS